MEISRNEVIEDTFYREWLNPNEVNKEFGFSVSTLAKWRMKKIHLNYTKIGKYIKYKRSDIIEFLEACSIPKVA
ncbi:helix-turn-helix domain-containing protein [Sulfurimonas sp. SAG-AH-194-L11]|nr:helix-turn-helix domain-containing protein [Sulfurimonas sp. SAG-AH-194-L11]MDF1877006.1 helix-turn-helix domain-containing protein [Sulfurimonas sp. SAG-AH-194-L11]